MRTLLLISSVLLGSLLGNVVQNNKVGLASNLEKAISAATRGDLSSFRSLVAIDSSLVSATNPEGTSLIQYAAAEVSQDESGQRKIVQFLLSKNSECDIFTATRAGILDEVRSILDFNPDLLNARNLQGYTPLQIAALAPVELRSAEKIAQYLIQKGAELDLVSAIRLGLTDEALQLVKTHEDWVERTLSDGSSALLWAAAPRKAHSRSKELIALLLKKGASASACDKKGRTVLHYLASASDDKDLAEFLIDKGADLSKKDSEGKTAYERALAEKHLELAQVLVSPKN